MTPIKGPAICLVICSLSPAMHLAKCPATFPDNCQANCTADCPDKCTANYPADCPDRGPNNLLNVKLTIQLTFHINDLQSAPVFSS